MKGYKMNKFLNLGMAIAALALSAVIVAKAAETPAQKALVLQVPGAVTWTNEKPYAVFQLNSVEFSGLQPNDATAVVKRISTVLPDNSTNRVTVTNTLASVVCTSGAGAVTNLTRNFFYGDKVLISAAGTNAGNTILTGKELP